MCKWRSKSSEYQQTFLDFEPSNKILSKLIVGGSDDDSGFYSDELTVADLKVNAHELNEANAAWKLMLNDGDLPSCPSTQIKSRNCSIGKHDLLKN